MKKNGNIFGGVESDRRIGQKLGLNDKLWVENWRIFSLFDLLNYLITSNMKKVAADVKLGQGVIIFDFVNLYGCEIGDNTKIGTFVEIQKGAKIGNNCKISSHTFICEGVAIADNVFVGHSVAFINDRYPRATSRGGGCRRMTIGSVIPLS